ncbi:phosphatidylinositol transfer protein alpha isoform-like isoform X2 [Paramacrobiotus metropolitanus]|nr:phosphatidylinositol transfer protein alpha isoform-like isoform X2 [Paramacrobiotus metropolitanus]XP_055340842.1 phosphatidylinositol transfer protein alpha isoform-like isoform X2 [Paramacrobiotus metropolitanus]
MIIKEYRIVMPMSVEEYQIGQLYAVAEASKGETGGGEGVQVLQNEPYENFPLLDGQPDRGQFTHKTYYLQSKVPSWVRTIAPKGSLEFTEKAWNAYPYCKTEFSNPSYMKEAFLLTVESLHLPDRGNSYNVHQLSPDKLKKRDVVFVDIANDKISSKDYKLQYDPQKFRSTKTGRGPLGSDWQASATPVMCCYKLVTVEFKWTGLQNKVENFIHKAEKRLFTNFHRQVFCSIDHWYGLTMQDIRELEEHTRKELDVQRMSGNVRSSFQAIDDGESGASA